MNKMITDDERFIKIQKILSFSDIHPNDCIKINDLMTELSKENKQLKEEIKILKMIVHGLNNRDLFPHKICEYINKIEEEMNWEEYLKFQGDNNE